MWWANAVFYEIYLPSFQDSNDDGVGDFGGVRRRLPYLAELGVDCLWVTPFCPSPGRDNGYDVADYTDVDPRYGSLADLRLLIDEAHQHELRVIIDVVPNHTSSDHPWFAAALASCDPYRDYYIWRDPAPNGGLPNNWTSHFGGPAWTWDPASQQFWLHSFLPEQPDLNWRNPDVRAEFDAILQFWLDLGVDGFRVDVAPGLVKDAAFRDNPLNPHAGSGMREYHQTLHVYDQDRPEVHAIYARWRAMSDLHDAVLVGEVNLPSAARVAQYATEDSLHVAMYFGLVESTWDPTLLCSRIRSAANASERLGWVLSSHDRARAVSRFGGGARGGRRALVVTAVTLFLPGPNVILQGEELGLDDGIVSDGDLRDTVFSDPLVVGRDGSRTTMPWDEAPYHGFSTVTPWLPSEQRDDASTVSHQLTDNRSYLAVWRTLMWASRGASAAGSATFLETPESVIAFTRGALLVLANLGSEPCTVAAASAATLEPLFCLGAFECHPEGLVWVDAESVVVLAAEA